MSGIDRRCFLRSAALAAAAARGALGAPAPRPRNAVLVTMLPKEVSYTERFRLARDAGFEGVEMQAGPDPREAEAIKAASAETGLRIHSVMNMEHWRNPLSSADRTQVDRSVAGMETSLRNAKLWGADAVLLVPAVVDRQTA